MSEKIKDGKRKTIYFKKKQYAALLKEQELTGASITEIVRRCINLTLLGRVKD